MATLHLTQHRVDTLKPKKAILDVRDTELKGFGIRIMPSGARRYFIHSQHEGRRLWKTFDDAGAVTVTQARQRARAMLAAYRNGDSANPEIDKNALFETVAEDVLVHHKRLWKPGTLAVNRCYLHRQILPFFAGRMISAITRQDVEAWFRSLHATPAAANRSLPILSVIMQKAETWGHRPENSNPCVGLRRYRETRRERFLLPAEYRSLAAALARHQATHPLHAAAVQLLILTGCRKSEIITLRWTDYREGRLFLRDSKTGPRTVWLAQAARDVLDNLPRKNRWVFSATQPKPHHLDEFWRRVRSEAGLNDVRLHDLRHSYASVALQNGETILTIGKLLGHRMASTTLRYSHFSDRAIREAVDVVAPVLSEGLS
ncbi:MAG: tyrosine-type recombinase/integrase [bacterium]|nr:tyrosine-type recombinase/integrase [bacterium]MDE0418144.1 tyrosine-type recombinase/integrase [bacterium]